jgi:DNA-binding SARP family transcriptional activator
VRSAEQPAPGRPPVALGFRLLGPPAVVSRSVEVPLPGERQRRILALLLVTPRRLVTVAEIVAAAWDGEPPATARRQVHTAVWRLRRVLAQHGGADLLASSPAGYRLDVDPDQVDVHRFEALVAVGRRLARAGRLADAVRDLRAAAALWSGPASAGLGGPVLGRQALRLEELRLTALEDTVEYELAAGAGPDLIAELVQLAGEHPLRERFTGALMLALYRAGRQGEALHLFHRVSRLLRDELGVGPGRRLTGRYTAILRRDPALHP